VLDSEFDNILQAARAKESWAWEAIYRNLSPIVLGYLRTRNASEAEDLTGAVFLGVVTEISRFEGDERAFRTWVLTIAHRRLVDSHRHRGRSLEEIRSELPEKAVLTGNVESEALERLDTEHVRRLLASLSPDQQDVLLLRILGDQTIDEVAKILGKRRGAVKALQRRGVAALRRRLIALGRTPMGSSGDYQLDDTPNR
jgi:RNA polymerase sigma factor (sigma-70 family)